MDVGAEEEQVLAVVWTEQKIGARLGAGFAIDEGSAEDGDAEPVAADAARVRVVQAVL